MYIYTVIYLWIVDILYIYKYILFLEYFYWTHDWEQLSVVAFR